MKRLVMISALALGALSTPPALADSKYQAKAMGNLELRAGPSWRYAVIGGVRSGAKFTLRVCTREHGWCQLVNKRGEAIGWVQADRLSGVSAKAQVTPWKPLFDPFRDGWPHRGKEKSQP